VEADLRPLNIGLSSAWRKASGRADWRHVVDTARVRHKKKKKKLCASVTPAAEQHWVL